MTYYPIANDMTGTANAPLLNMAADNDQVFVQKYVIVHNVNFDAIIGTASHQYWRIDGEVSTSLGAALSVGKINLATFANLVSIAESGFVRTGSVNASAIVIRSEQSRLNNYGMIQSAGDGITMSGAGGNEKSNIGNDGVIDVMSNAITKTGNEKLGIHNDGKISSLVAFIDRGNGFGDVDLSNSGTIRGDIFFGNGNDTYSGLSGHLEGASRVIGGKGNDTIYGGIDEDTLFGSEGNDVLVGGPGILNPRQFTPEADYMSGGAGNDTFYVDHVGDTTVEAVGGGNDKVLAGSSYALAANAEIEVLVTFDAASTAAQNLTGNNFDQTIQASNGVNRLSGGGGIDKMYAYAGNDTLYGGLGNDLLSGGAGNDAFVFNTRLNAVTNLDHITDFRNVSGDNDLFQLENAIFSKLTQAGALAGKLFKDISKAALDPDDRILYKSSSGDLYYDTDGSGTSKPVLFAHLDNKAALTAADFFVV